jgi:hypothetical protein
MGDISMEMANQSNLLANAVHQIETQAMQTQVIGSCGVGMGDVVIDGQGQLGNQQMSMSQPASTSASVTPSMGETVSGQGQQRYPGSRRQSGGVPITQGQQQMPPMNMSTSTVDLSSEVHEKLSLIER